VRMGCTNSGSEKKTPVSDGIDKMLRDEQKTPTKTKVLLLGTGESGKTTFLKQVIFLTNEGGVTDPRLQLKNVGAMHENVISGMKTLVERALEEELLRKTKEVNKALDVLNTARDVLGAEEAHAVKFLWEQEAIKEVWDKKNLLLPASLSYFLNDIDRISAPDFVMTPDDILRVRYKTTGVQCYDIPQKGKERGWSFIDVGGQQSERRKWIHAFEDVNAVLYLSALDSYDMVLEEEQKTPRLEDDIRLFGEVICTPFLPQLWIFFQNKRDLLETKIATSPLSNYFSDVDKSQEKDFEYAVTYLRSKFEEKIPTDSKLSIQFHVICALDTNQFEHIFNDIRIYIISKTLNNMRL